MTWWARVRAWWEGPAPAAPLLDPQEPQARPTPERVPLIAPIEAAPIEAALIETVPHWQRRRRRQNAHVATQAAVHGGM